MNSTTTAATEGPATRYSGKATHHEYAAGLRRLADMLDRLDESVRISYLDAPSVWCPRNADEVALIIRAGLAAGAEIVKYGAEDSAYRNVGVRFGAVEAMALVSKATVCERVVVGTETIEVPDPTFIPPGAPMVERVVDKVEWRCRPLLAGSTEEAAA